MDVNYKKAIEWYEKAAEQGLARLSIIWVYVPEWPGVDVNHKKAFEWYKKAAEQGDAKAQCNLGRCTMKAMAWMNQRGLRVVREGGGAGTRRGSV